MRPYDVIRLFEFHHIVFHAPPFNGPDSWWNLDPQVKAKHRERSGRDASTIAKVKRLRDAPAVPAGAPKPSRPPRQPPKRKIAQRDNPWPPRGTRKINWQRTSR